MLCGKEMYDPATTWFNTHFASHTRELICLVPSMVVVKSKRLMERSMLTAELLNLYRI